MLQRLRERKLATWQRQTTDQSVPLVCQHKTNWLTVPVMAESALHATHTKQAYRDWWRRRHGRRVFGSTEYKILLRHKMATYSDCSARFESVNIAGQLWLACEPATHQHLLDHRSTLPMRARPISVGPHDDNSDSVDLSVSEQLIYLHPFFLVSPGCMSTRNADFNTTGKSTRC